MKFLDYFADIVRHQGTWFCWRVQCLSHIVLEFIFGQVDSVQCTTWGQWYCRLFRNVISV